MDPADLHHNIEMFHSFPLENRKGEAFKCDVTGSRLSAPYDSQHLFKRASRAAGKYSTKLLGGKSTSETIVPVSRESFHAALLHPEDFGGREFVKEALERLKTLEDSYAQTKDTDPEHETIHRELSLIRKAGEIAINEDLSKQQKKFLEILSSESDDQIKQVMEFLVEDIGKERFGVLLASLSKTSFQKALTSYGRNEFIDKIWVYLEGDCKPNLKNMIPDLSKNERSLHAAAANIVEKPNALEAAWSLEQVLMHLKLSGVETRFFMKLILESVGDKRLGEILNHVDSVNLKKIDLALGYKYLGSVLNQYSEAERSEFIHKLKQKDMGLEVVAHNLEMLSKFPEDKFTKYFYRYTIDDGRLSEPKDQLVQRGGKAPTSSPTRANNLVPVVRETFHQIFLHPDEISDETKRAALEGLERLTGSYLERGLDESISLPGLKQIHLAASVAWETDVDKAAKLIDRSIRIVDFERVFIPLLIQYVGYPKFQEIIPKLKHRKREAEAAIEYYSFGP